MKNRSFIIIGILCLCLLNSLSPVFGAIKVREIEKVRNKAVLDRSDSAVVETFLNEAVKELVEVPDYTSISGARGLILGNHRTNQPSAEDQYRQIFTKSVRQAIAKGSLRPRPLKSLKISLSQN